MNILFIGAFWVSIIISFLTSIWYALHGTLSFHTDIARDFLLIEDIVVNKKISLIGPHSGGIEGVFHGPLWLYLNAPVFFLGKGSPAAVAWFWALLSLCGIGILYWVTKKLSDTKTAMIATALYGLVIAGSSANLFNPSGAVFLAPLFFYFFIRYMKSQNFLHLIISLFVLGLIIQFQMAWGVPILILMLPILFRHFFIHKKFSHISSFAILTLPLSTFILFDLRHQFLQIKSVIAYIAHPTIIKKVPLVSFLGGRIYDMWLGIITIFAGWNGYLHVFYAFLFFGLVYFAAKNKKKIDPVIFYFFYFYIGYFIITLVFKGTMWGYYTIPFIPLFCIAVAILITYLPKKWEVAFFLLFVIPLLFMNIKNLLVHDAAYFKRDSGLWTFYHNQAKKIYKDANGDFGWYVYTADQYGYSAKYAMHFAQRSNTVKGFSYEKKPLLYLIIAPSTNVHTNEKDWKKDKIKITRKPDKVFSFQDGSYVEKYILTPAEQTVSAASDLIQDLMFR